MLRRLYFALWMGCGFIMSAWAQCSHPLRFAMQDFRPYVYFDEKHQPAGLDVDVLAAVAEQAGCTVQYFPPVPGRRMMEMFRNGRLDVLVGASKTRERLEFARFTRSYRDEVIGLFALSERVPPHSVQSFDDITRQHLHLLAPLHGWYGPAYEAAKPALIAKGAIYDFEGTEQGLRMLDANRAQLIMGDTYAIADLAQRMGLGELKAIGLVANRDPVFMMFSKASMPPGDVDMLDLALARLEKEGKIKALINRYALH